MPAISLPVDTRLPLELVYYVLDFLCVPDLRRAAGVSRRFRTVVKRIAHFSIALNFTQPRHILGACDAFADVIAQRLPISLTLDLSSVQSHIVVPVCSVLTSMFPYLVELHLTVPKKYRTTLDHILCTPAPSLRYFSLRHHHILYALPSSAPLPVNIFGGKAPKLRRLTLHDVPFSAAPAIALSRIQTLELYCSFETPDVELVHHVPSVHELLIHFLTFDAQWGVPPFRIKCRGLNLTRLEVHDGRIISIMEQIARDITISQIPLVVQVPHGTTPDIWSPLGQPYSLRVGRMKTEHAIALRARDNGARRILRHRYPPIVPLTPKILKIHELRMDLGHVLSLINMYPRLALPSLESLEIDVVPLDTQPTIRRTEESFTENTLKVLCACLRAVRVFNTNPNRDVLVEEAFRAAAAFRNDNGLRPRLEVVGYVNDEAITGISNSFAEISLSRTTPSSNMEWEDFDDYV